VWNRPPLAPNRLATLRPGSIEARGWLREQLRLSAAGLTGHMMDIWPDVGPSSGWLGGGGENWERGPYYARGLVALAHAVGATHASPLRERSRGSEHSNAGATHASALRERAAQWIEWTLQSQRGDGFFGPSDNDDWWARMPMLEALRWHAEASGDARVAPFLSRYFQYQHAHLPGRPLETWAKPRGADNLAAVLWLYNRTGEHHLLALADLLQRQTSDWLGELGGDGPPSDAFDFAHGVNRAHGFKAPAVYYQRSRDPAHLAVLRRGWERTMAHHGQIHGLYSGDEFLHGGGSTQGTELCTIVELLSSFETALAISGEAWLGDAIERIAFNALPATLSPDLCGHQYFQLPNQVECTPGARHFSVPHDNDLLFGPATGYGCCAANFHMGWPRLVQHLWLAMPDGLVAPLFAPCTLRTAVGRQPLTVIEDTDYPFGDVVAFTVRVARPVRFTLGFRLPAWADEHTVELNGRPAKGADGRTGGRADVRATRRQHASTSTRQHSERPVLPGCIRLTHTWKDGDTVRVHLPMRVRLSHWERGAVGVERGPLVYALRIGEDWRAVAGSPPFSDYELRPTTAWNYALVVDPAAPERTIRVEHRAGAAQPWAQDGAPVVLRATGRRLDGWASVHGFSGPIPEPPLGTASDAEPLTLIPYGCARLRIAMFPHLPP